MICLTRQIAQHFREVHLGGNWTGSNLKDTLAGIDWQQATTQVYDLNTIATLVFHIHYYVEVVSKRMRGETLQGKDEDSFAHPPIHNQADWERLLDKMRTEAEDFAQQIETMPEQKLWKNIAGEKYGNYYRNLHGIIEHTHYHLGQIALVKKIILQGDHN